MIVMLAFVALFANDLPPRLTDLPYTQNFDGPDFPADWTEVTTGPIAIDRWVPLNSAFTGGEPWELHCFGTPGAGITRLISPQINTSGVAAFTAQFLHTISFYDLGLIFRLEYSHDLVNWQTTSWSVSEPGLHVGLVRATLSGLDAPATYLSWTLEGDQMGMEGAILDNIYLHLPVTELNTPELQISDSGLLSWDAVPNALSYDIYSADGPDGEFNFEATVATNFWQSELTEPRKFYRVIAIY